MSNISTESSAELDTTLTFIEDVAQRVRACVRAFLIGAWTAALFGVRLSVAPVAAFDKTAERALRRKVLRAWAWGVCRTVRARVTVRGHAPSAPFILVSNHLSYFDAIVYSRLLGAVFVSMVEVNTWPLIGLLARGLNNLFVDRTKRRDASRVNAEIADVVQQGHGLVLFPESTTTYGAKLLPFHGALLQPAVDLRMPVHYAAIWYATAPGDIGAEYSICWVDDTPFATHAFRLLRLRQFDVTVEFGNSPVIGHNRKLLAARLHSEVDALLCGRVGRLDSAS